MAQRKWSELTKEEQERVLQHEYECTRDDPWNTAQYYAESRIEAFREGVDYVDSFAGFVDWWDTMEEDYQQEILFVKQQPMDSDATG